MRERAKVGVFPAYRDNPYLNLLGLAARARGYSMLDSTSLEGLERVAAALGSGDALHLHWTSPIVQRAETAEEARARLARFRDAVDEAAVRGVAVIWTIHNIVPHDPRHEELELELCRYLSDRAHAIHAMTSDVTEAAAPFYVVDPEKVVVIPHPSYQGVYPAPASREAARDRLGLAADEHAILFFGQLRPYKGLSTLLSAAGRIGADGARPVLLLAGRAADDDRRTLEDLLPAGVRTIGRYEHIPDAEVGHWFLAADVAVLPYERVLNSGTLHLAASFGLPVVLPDDPHLRRVFGDEAWITWYDRRQATESLQTLLGDEATYRLPRRAARAFSRRLAPYAISERYADLLDERLASATR